MNTGSSKCGVCWQTLWAAQIGHIILMITTGMGGPLCSCGPAKDISNSLRWQIQKSKFSPPGLLPQGKSEGFLHTSVGRGGHWTMGCSEDSAVDSVGNSFKSLIPTTLSCLGLCANEKTFMVLCPVFMGSLSSASGALVSKTRRGTPLQTRLSEWWPGWLPRGGEQSQVLRDASSASSNRTQANQISCISSP